MAMTVGTAPIPAPDWVTSGSNLRRPSAPEISAIEPASMKAISRRSLTSGESLAKEAGPAAKAAGYCTASPRVPRMATEPAASPVTASISTLTPQARSSAGSLAAVIAIGAIMKGMLPCWNFWSRESGSTAAKTAPPFIRCWSTA